MSSGNEPYSLMLVDDSTVIRGILKQMLGEHPLIKIIGEAENGLIGISKAKELRPDIIILDIEMPEMDGITALPQIIKASPDSQVIMCSTLTQKNAEISIKAMNNGAADYLQKPEANLNKESFKTELIQKIMAIGLAGREKKRKSSNINTTANIAVEEVFAIKPISYAFKPEVIAIASSTGGPQALQTLFEGLKGKLPNLPVLITQHMPPIFTKLLATSLANSTGLSFHEAENGMTVSPGNIYIAPGDFHMLVEKDVMNIKIKLSNAPHENYCRPAADPMLRSIAEVYDNKVLVTILTGMGQDGMLGAKLISEKGGVVIAQDKESSVVWGMPGAACNAGITSGAYPINMLAERISMLCSKSGGLHAPK